jgi:hypothetical protein
LSDHKNLEYWQTKKDLNLRQARWGEQLANYDFRITYRPGKLAGKPDILSCESGDSPWEGEIKHRQNKGRILLPEETFRINAAEEMIIMQDKELLEEIRTETGKDKEMQETIQKLRAGERIDNRVALGLCEEKEGILTYEGLIWVPQNDKLQLRLLHDHHDALIAGHPGQARTLELLARKYYWPQQRQYVHRYVDNCDTCKRIKPIRHAPFALLKPLQLPTRPWDSISMDFIMGLPEVDNCNALWVIVDRLMKMSYFIACKDTMGPQDLAEGFILHVVRAHRLPNSIISDRGSLFTSKFWKQIMMAMGTTRNLSTTFHPETDGQTDYTNAILEQYLRAYCNYQQNNWKQLLPIAEFCYNNTKSESTGVTPFYANFGYHPRFQPDLKAADSPTPDVSNYISCLNTLQQELRAEIQWAQAGQAEQVNKGRQPDPILQKADKVWLRRKYVKTTRPSNKLDFKLIGPYSILEKIGSKAYKLDLPPSVKIHPVFHISLLEPTTTQNTPIPGHLQPPPPPVIINNEEEWEVEEITDSCYYRKTLQYRVRWKGFHDEDKTWYPATNFDNSPEAIQQFHKNYPRKPAPPN